MNASHETITRTVVLVILLINQICTIVGANPLPWSETELYQGVSVLLTTLGSLWAWWKNNSFTEAALLGDQYMTDVREAKQGK